jgi:hypothetical protein
MQYLQRTFTLPTTKKPMTDEEYSRKVGTISVCANTDCRKDFAPRTRSGGEPKKYCTKDCGERYRAKQQRDSGYTKRYRTENRDKYQQSYRKSYLKTRYGMTIEQFNELMERQQNACGLCKEPFKEGEFPHVDHDHTCCPGKNSCGRCIRGVLHSTCNRVIGLTKDNPNLCRQAAEYLEQSR